MSIPGKDYIDRGIQTESLQPHSASNDETVTFTSGTPNSHINGIDIIVPSSPEVSDSPHLQTSSQFGAYSHSLDETLNLGHSLAISRRSHNRPQFIPSNRSLNPPDSRERRIVSLPETSVVYPSETFGGSSAKRTVSMTDCSRLSVLPSERNSINNSDCIENSVSADNSYTFTDEQHIHSHIRSFPSDLPYTPSPPSSPESIMIIGNDVQVPRTFLRQKEIIKSQPAYRDEDGWITWASSPPRPIPALHGPLSLPYARCPSGAEGTIIEGPEDLHRMIWGLDADEPQPTQAHPRLRSQSQHGTVNRSSTQVNVPPRLQKLQVAESVHAFPPQFQCQIEVSNVIPRSAHSSMDYDRRTQLFLHQRTLETLGCQYPSNHQNRGDSDKPRTERIRVSTSEWSSIHGNVTPEHLIDDIHMCNMRSGLGLEWNAALPNLKLKSGLDSSHATKSSHHLKPSAPVFVPSRQPLYPRIFIEPRPSDLDVIPTRGKSAIEIAQQYRKQQQHQQSALPTPPSSSSPVWSPYLSTYQDTVFSPVLSPSLLSRSTIHSLPPIGGYPRELRKIVSKRNGNMFDMDLGATQSSRPLRSTIIENANVTTSPRYPGPPPNTPLLPVPTVREAQSKHHSDRQAPLFPISPATRTRSLSYQHPRSVPLARLIQRRLSSVPEEDIGSFLDHAPSFPSGGTPNSSLDQLSRTPSLTSLTQPRQPLVHSLSVIAGIPPRTPSPVKTSFVSHTRTGLGNEGDSMDLIPTQEIPALISKSGAVPATVRLPKKLQRVKNRCHARPTSVLPHKDVTSADRVGDDENTTSKITPKKKNRGKKTKTSGMSLEPQDALQLLTPRLDVEIESR